MTDITIDLLSSDGRIIFKKAAEATASQFAAAASAATASSAATTAVAARDGILNNTGFQLVAADLALAGNSKIGIVATSIANVNAAGADLLLGAAGSFILRAPALAASAATSASIAGIAANESFGSLSIDLSNTVLIQNGRTDLVGSGSFGGGAFYFPAEASKVFGLVDTLVVNTSGGSSNARVAIVRPSPDYSTAAVIDLIAVTVGDLDGGGAGAGERTIILTRPLRVSPGDRIGFDPGSATLSRGSNTTSDLYFQVTATAAAQSVTLTRNQGITPALKALIKAQRTPAATRADMSPSAAKGPFPIVRQNFAGTSLPGDWQFSAGWTANDGLSFSGTGGNTTLALQGRSPDSASLPQELIRYSTLNTKRLRCRVRLSADAIFGLVAQPQENLPQKGAIAMVDRPAGIFRLYYWNGLATLTQIGTAALPAGYTGTDTVVIEARHEGSLVTAKFTDPVSQGTSVINYNFETAAGDTQPFFHGRPGFMHVAGTSSGATIVVEALNPKFLRGILVGDSITEESVRPTQNPGWAQQVVAARKSLTGDLYCDIAVTAQGGARANAAIYRGAPANMMSDIYPFRPEYVIYFLGANDGVLADWRRGVELYRDAAAAIGAEFVLCTLPPHTNQTKTNQFNADILSGYFGKFRVIDFAGAVTLNHDRVTKVTANIDPDGVHPSKAGHDLMYAQVLADLPELLAA